MSTKQGVSQQKLDSIKSIYRKQFSEDCSLNDDQICDVIAKSSATNNNPSDESIVDELREQCGQTGSHRQASA